MVLLQTAVAYVFMQRHWDIVTHRLSAAVARDVGAMVDLYAGLPPGADDPKLHAIAARFHMDVELLPPGPLPPKTPQTFFNVLDPLTRALPEELGAQVQAAVLGRHGRPLRADGDPRQSRRAGAALRHPPHPRLRAQRPYLHPLDARRLVGAGDGRDPVPAQPDPADPPARRRGGGFRQGPRRRVPSARRARSAPGRLRLHRDEAAHRARHRAAHGDAQRRQPRPAHHAHPLQAVARRHRRIRPRSSRCRRTSTRCSACSRAISPSRAATPASRPS